MTRTASETACVLVALWSFQALGDTSSVQAQTEPSPTASTLQVTPAAGEIRIDGYLSDPAWQDAAATEEFFEIRPGYNTAPEVTTRALVTYTTSHLYLAFIAYDNPSEIRASICDRDRIFRDDYIGIMLDTYNDQIWAYEFMANPFGVQGDARLTEGGGEDLSLDLVYESSGIVTDSGYQVEMAIPFASLRFPDREEQVWRFTFWRERPRESIFWYVTAPDNKDQACGQCRWGYLRGIANIKPGSNLDILPTLLTYQTGQLDDPDSPISGFSYDDPDAELALNLRYSLSSSSSLELAVNPDFSQIESDAGQIDVNQTFALFFPERRPFFQEGSDLYRSYYNTVYTRSINDPILAGKFTGQYGQTSLAVLAARDEHSFVIVPLAEQSTTVPLKEATSSIVRLRQAMGQDSYLGLIMTDRRSDQFSDETLSVGSGANSLGAFDGRIRLAPSLAFNFMAVASHTNEPDGGHLIDTVDGLRFAQSRFGYGEHTVALDGEKYSGYGLMLGLRRSTRHLAVNMEYRESTPTLRMGNGFFTVNDRRMLFLDGTTTWEPNRAWLVDYGLRFQLGRVFEHRSRFTLNPASFNPDTRDEWLRFGIRMRFKGQTNIRVEYLASREWFRGQLFTGISRIFANLFTRPTGAVTVTCDFEHGRKVYRAEPIMGMLTRLTATSTINLGNRLQTELSYNYSRMNHRHHYYVPGSTEDRTIYSGYIFRDRIDYQFTRHWSARLIVEYNDFAERVDSEWLLTYKVNPFTVFYAGMGNRHQHYDQADYDELDRSDWRSSQRQFFAKFQYLFRI